MRAFVFVAVIRDGWMAEVEDLPLVVETVEPGRIGGAGFLSFNFERRFGAGGET